MSSWRRASPTFESRALGCLLGGAVGDALGAPIEFLKLDAIRKAHGPAGLTDYAPAYGRIGAITDDTQMTLFTAEGLLRAYVRAATKGICNPTSVVLHAYLRWLRTQGETSQHQLFPKTDEATDGWLAGHRDLWSRRGPGATCLSALRDPPGDLRAKNDSKGCGGLMRVAPVGLFYSSRAERGHDPAPLEMGKDLAWLTHGHVDGWHPAAYFAQLIALLRDGHDLRAAVDLALAQIEPWHYAEGTLAAIDRAVKLADDGGAPTAEKLATLGEGWVADEALAIALYCALVARDFEHGVLLAVNHSGDSDSTGSLVGNLLGVRWGVETIPSRWLERLELRDVIATLAKDLVAAREEKLDAEDEAVWERYPGW